MFTENMIAPCGLDCSICSQALNKEEPCAGCNGPDDNKPEFCATMCTIIKCVKRRGYRFCDECRDFPCKDSAERESRYLSQYAMKESPFENMKAIRENGMKAFLETERKKWTCECGGIICVHDGICSDCGRIHG